MGRVFGPVPSRRLGFSLGVDPLVAKTCTMDCVYCELGPTTTKTVSRAPYVDVGSILEELKSALGRAERVDHVTVSGSGEPTLNSGLGELISGIRELTDIPVAVLTNGSLFTDRLVRAECALADIVAPSLDAVTPSVFRDVTRPHESLDPEAILAGLAQFADTFAGRVWLEIVFVKGMNDSPQEVSRLSEAISIIGPERVHVNTVVRPPSQSSALPLPDRELRSIAERLGGNAEVVAGPAEASQSLLRGHRSDLVVSMARRRPVTVLDVARALGTSQAEAAKILGDLAARDLVVVVRHGESMYYRGRDAKGGVR